MLQSKVIRAPGEKANTEFVKYFTTCKQPNHQNNPRNQNVQVIWLMQYQIPPKRYINTICRGLQDSKFVLHTNIFHHLIYLADSANCIVGGTFSKSQVCEVLHQKASVVKAERLLIKKCQYVTCISRFSKFDCWLYYRYLQYAVKVKLLKLLKAHYCFFQLTIVGALLLCWCVVCHRDP